LSERCRDRKISEAFEGIWSTLNELISDLKARGVEIPEKVYISMEGTGILISLCKCHACCGDLDCVLQHKSLRAIEGFCTGCCGQDVVSRIICELRNVEDLLFIKAFRNIGENYAKQWQSKLDEYWKKLGEAMKGLH